MNHSLSPVVSALLVLPLTILTSSFAVAEPAHSAPAAAETKRPATEEVLISAKGLPQIWLKGDAITEFAPGTLYVFEFWATWCGPCLAAMPHMEVLYQDTKSDERIQIVGVNVMDKTPTDRLMPFLKGKDLQLNYRQAADERADGPVAEHWLQPLKINGIPHVIAVRDGILVWRGHPNQLNLDMLKAMSDPAFTPEKKTFQTPAEIKEEQNRRESAIRGLAAKDPEATFEQLKETLPDEHHDEGEVIALYHAAFRGFVESEHYDQARKTVTVLVERFSDHRDALLNGGNWLLTTEELGENDHAQIIQIADQLLKTNSNDWDAMELKAGGLFQAGDATQAAALQQQVVKNQEIHQKINQLRSELNP